MKLYAASIYARRDDAERGAIIRHTAISIVARSAQEARGIALEQCEGMFPLSSGWTAHSAAVTEVLQSALDGLKHAD